MVYRKKMIDPRRICLRLLKRSQSIGTLGIPLWLPFGSGISLSASVRRAFVLKLKTDEVTSEEGAADENEGEDSSKPAEPMVAVVNVHLEGHPRRFSERTHQLQHAISDLAKRIEHERKNGEQSTASEHEIGKLNALVLAGDFNCELQSSACSTYLCMRRLHHPPSFLIRNYRGHRGDTPDHGMGTSVAGRKGERCRCQSLSKEWHDQRLPRLVGTG